MYFPTAGIQQYAPIKQKTHGQNYFKKFLNIATRVVSQSPESSCVQHRMQILSLGGNPSYVL